MSGDLLIRNGSKLPDKHDRLIFTLSNGRQLVFNDTRKFGRVWLTDDLDYVLGALGPEPLESIFTPDWLFENLHRRKRQLKPLLLDQTFLAGLGNIYADEALHTAKLHPLAGSASVTRLKAAALHSGIRAVLEEGIRRNGASIDWVYRGGDYQNHFRVYGRAGKPCPVCGRAIRRIIVGQRSTHFCPRCQAR
jgi:formamidopyrimidine-DNA glycosylase